MQRKEGFLEMWVELQLDLRDKTNRKLLFPGLLRKTSIRSTHMQEFQNHIDLVQIPGGNNFSKVSWHLSWALQFKADWGGGVMIPLPLLPTLGLCASCAWSQTP